MNSRGYLTDPIIEVTVLELITRQKKPKHTALSGPQTAKHSSIFLFRTPLRWQCHAELIFLGTSISILEKRNWIFGPWIHHTADN